nr:monodehydroascorbate reductase [Tanacetum cinerariifolium]
MANENVSALAPIRSDDKILPYAAWLGYPGEIHIVLRMAVNNMYQPWRAILSMINQCLTCKTSGFDRPRYQVLQMMWGIITHTNIEYAELMWEEFVQAIQTFLADKANLGSPTKKGKKTKPHVILYSRFTKLIIYYLGRHHNIHQSSGSPPNRAEDDLSLRNLKFVPKGEIDEVFGMKILEELITDNIRNAPYYNAYLEMVAKHERGIAAAKEGGKKKITPKADKPVKPAPAQQAKPETTKQPKPKLIKDKPTKLTLIQKASKRRTPATEKASTGPSAQPQDDTSAHIVGETPYHADAKTCTDTEKVISKGDTEILNIGEEQEEDVDNQVYLEEQTAELDEAQAGSDLADALAKSYKDPEENKLLSKTGDMGSYIKRLCKRIGKKKLSKSDLEGLTFKVVRAFHENNISLQFQMEECHQLLTDQVDLVNPEGHRLVLDASKPLPLGGPPDFGLKELVPSLWIESKCDYNISAAYGITHWWFKRKDFYITRHNATSDRRAVRSHMRILNVISIKTFERFCYAFLREIVIRRADYNEYKISEADFKNQHPNDFEQLYLLHLQRKLNHLPGSDKVHLYNAINLWIRNIVIKQHVGYLQLGIESYQTKLNLTEPRWDASDFLFKEDYTIVSKPRASSAQAGTYGQRLQAVPVQSGHGV